MYNNHSLRKRILIASFAGFSLVIALLARLFWVQIINGGHLQLLAAEQWYRDLPLTAPRGNIYDANGRILAESVNTFNVYVRPSSVKNAEAVAQLLSSHLDLTYDSVFTKINKKTVSEWLIKMQVEKEVALKLVSANLAGIYLSENTKRFYPYGGLASQVLGYTSIDGYGQEGVETYYNQFLKGIDGKALTQADLRGRQLDNTLSYYVPSIAGIDLCLNIDYVIQSFLQSALTKMFNENNAKQTYGMVYDNRTGAVVAQGTYPNYDLNNPPRDNLDLLLYGIKNQPVVNVLEPGSTFKILTLAAAIEEGVVKEDDKFNCPGFRVIDGEKVKCWRTKGHGQITLAEGVAKSCNCVFMDLALRLGVDKYYSYMQKFSIGQKTGIDFYGESNGITLPKNTVRNVDLARIGFGHAVAVTPVQLQSIVGAIVGGGVLYRPQIASELKKDGKVVKSINPVIRAQICSEKTSKAVAELLRGVVLDGSGKGAYVDGYYIGGKTGTAQKYHADGHIDQGKYVSSFFGFCETGGVADYSVMLFVDEPKAKGYYGGVVAAPYANAIFENIFSFKNIAPRTELINRKMTVKNINIPSLAHLDVETAIERLEALGLFVEVDGEGDIVLGCIPGAGAWVSKGDVVVLLT